MRYFLFSALLQPTMVLSFATLLPQVPVDHVYVSAKNWGCGATQWLWDRS